MNLQERIELLARLGRYIKEDTTEWQAAKHRASVENNWFVPQFTHLASSNIAEHYLSEQALELLVNKYSLQDQPPQPKIVGIVMAGNIPLVGFHDLLCVFISGHRAKIKLSSKDEVLTRHLVDTLTGWNPEIPELIEVSEMLKNCDAYIATGSSNTSQYFDYYFSKYPHIIRQNKTSVAILTGKESREDLDRLADDIHLYFGLGCRNVTKIFVPENYDFLPLLEASTKYAWMMNHNKYKNNYDYALAVQIINNKFYMTNGNVLLIENPSLFPPISQVNYQMYSSSDILLRTVNEEQNLQCRVGLEATPFGEAQTPGVCDFADGVDTMEFLLKL